MDMDDNLQSWTVVNGRQPLGYPSLRPAFENGLYAVDRVSPARAQGQLAANQNDSAQSVHRSFRPVSGPRRPGLPGGGAAAETAKRHGPVIFRCDRDGSRWDSNTPAPSAEGASSIFGWWPN